MAETDIVPGLFFLGCADIPTQSYETETETADMDNSGLSNDTFWFPHEGIKVKPESNYCKRVGTSHEVMLRDKNGKAVMPYASYTHDEWKVIVKRRKAAKAAKQARKRNRKR